MIPHPLVLEGVKVRLEPLDWRHAAGLEEAAQEAELFRYFRPGNLADAARREAWMGESIRLREAGVDYPFVIVERAGGSVAGSTRYRLLDGVNRSVEIGGTWVARQYWGTGVNREAKRLMLAHAFETLCVIRVQFRTDERNERSQRAIEALGAVREGVLRKDFV